MQLYFAAEIVSTRGHRAVARRGTTSNSSVTQRLIGITADFGVPFTWFADPSPAQKLPFSSRIHI
jgi:hypothetical protein